MALAERAELVARLTLQDNFTSKARGVLGSLGKMEGSFGRIAGHAQRGLTTAAGNLAKIGAVAGGFVALNVRAGVNSLAELEDAVTAVDGAIDQVGKGWTTTGQTIAKWANEIEAATDAAFDDKEITAAATTLIRYGSVTEDNLRPALEVMTDLAAKTGDVGSSSTILAKALAAPEKASGRLARMGIVLTDQQEKQIKALTDAGKAAEAQALLLDILAEKTKGAAAASAGPYRDALNKMRDATEDAQRVLGEAFLPVIGKVADKLQKAVQDEGFMDQVREFGQNMAGAFDKAVEFAGNVPWGLIGQSLKTAGQGAKAIFDAFTMLPPWVQQTVITGWGLNKLTGGALGSIVGELGKGLIKGVLGMTAGVVNIKAGVVNGAGGTGATGGGVGGVVGGAIVAGVAAQAVMDAGTIASGVQRAYEAGQQRDVQGVLDAQRDILNQTVLLPPGIRELGSLFASKQQELVNTLNGTIDVKPQGMSPDERQAVNNQRQKTAELARKMQEAKAAQVAASERSRSAIVAAERSGTSAIVSAIRGIQRPIVSVSVTGNTVRTVYSTGGTITRNVQPGILALN